MFIGRLGPMFPTFGKILVFIQKRLYSFLILMMILHPTLEELHLNVHMQLIFFLIKILHPMLKTYLVLKLKRKNNIGIKIRLVFRDATRILCG